jgi:hypothetical protein
MPWKHVLCVVALAACTDNSETDTDTDAPLCGNEDSPTIELGRGVGGAFEPFADQQMVGLEVAPQGGFGVGVQIRTEGLQGDAPVTVTVRTSVDGVVGGEFTFINDDGVPTQNLFCRDDGFGALGAGITVGFDKEAWTQDNLTDLDGKVSDLIVEITDESGTTATGTSTVLITVGG